MDLIYANQGRLELGVLQNYDVDFDTTNQKDFQITVGINNNMLKGGYWWYIEGTEYGGKVDKYEVLTESSEIRYTGRNFRGILTSKIIEPPAGNDYKIVSGNLQTIINGLISDVSMQDIFIADECDITISNHKINRYVNLYDGICAIATRYNLVPDFVVKDGMVHISFYHPIDYSDENEYTQDDIKFSITKTFSDVNHLICLGQGELKDRTVVHLYADKDGNVSDKQTLFGVDEVVEVYENTNAASAEELRTEGIEKLNELKNKDSFNVTLPDIDLKIGDIIGGWERVTNTYVAREIVNIIATFDDNTVSLEYKVGEDDTTGSSSSGSSSGTSGGGGGSADIKPATKTELGGIIVGDNLSIKEDGTLSANKQTDNNYTDTDKQKMDGIEENANKTIVDGELNEKSENPVQNKIITVIVENLKKRIEELENSIVNEKVEVTSKTFGSSGEAEGYTFASSDFGMGRLPWKAFNGNESDQWCCASTDNMDGEYIGYDFKEMIYPTGITIIINNSNGANPSFIVQASNDNELWVDLLDEISMTSNGKVTIYRTLQETTQYRMFRMLFTGGKQGSSCGVDVYEIKITGYKYE